VREVKFKLRFRLSDFLPLDFNLEIEGESEIEQYDITENKFAAFSTLEITVNLILLYLPNPRK
jgi:hypothetical protein